MSLSVNPQITPSKNYDIKSYIKTLKFQLNNKHIYPMYQNDSMCNKNDIEDLSCKCYFLRGVVDKLILLYPCEGQWQWNIMIFNCLAHESFPILISSFHLSSDSD